ncbi:hypothetical protein [Blautia sp. MSJ-19]|uniref:hypothetical protein n=1 Tax=Blautia sp. MSJ-19 TaxID=2841517 RepID=UPI001C0F0146|nr:hypothetical protein [Blautia sp. MSJ-19]MBU5481742.1 hypothetical protein [Blautia sp. MSJ-19]
MINVSDAFKKKLEDGERVWQIVDITFADGTTKTGVQNEIMSGNNSFSDCAESSSFPIGCVICKTMTLELDNTSDQWKNYNFYQAKVHAYLKMQTSVASPSVTDELLDENYDPILDQSGNPILATKAATEDRIETIDKGVYTITTPEQYGEILNFTALDDMYKTNAAYTSNLVLPQTVMNLVRDACETLDIPMGFSSMTHGNLIVNEFPDNMTFRQLFGWAAMLETANARLDSRGYLQFCKWDFSATPIELKDYINMPTVSSDDIVITGIRVKSGDNSELYGELGYVLELENSLIGEDDLATVAAQIGDSIIGAKFRSLQGDMAFNPLLEFGDMTCTYDRNMNKYLTPLTDVSYTINGKTAVKTQADDPIRGMSKFVSDGIKAIVEARRLVKIEKTAREKAIQRLADTLASSGGLYETDEKQEDGSTIIYLHNKPTLAESKTIIKFTAEAIGVSNDGGKTYPYGFILTGEMITRLLYAEGIDATYINAGTFTVRDKNGKVIFMADMENGTVRIDASYIQIGGSALDTTLENIQGQIDGSINKWTGTDAPTLDNYPAKNWLTDEERSKHVGDVYYDSKNQGYRFRNDGKGYSWQIVSDTDIAKALQDAAEAKEKAENAEKMAALAKNMTLQLSNDMQTITSDSDGNIPVFPSSVSTRATVMYGTQDITGDCSFTVTVSESISGSWNISTHTYTVTGLAADNGWVDIKATYLNNLSITKRFTVSKQKQGPQGIPGVGADGKTTYLHIRYSPVQKPTASQMTTVPDKNTQYIGVYSDFNGTPSANPSNYTWAKFKGDVGQQGPKGEDGKSSYTWMRYATRPDGLDMSDSPDYVKLLDSTGSPILDSAGDQIYTITQATYLGIATNKDTPIESDNPADYIWSRFRGVDGYDGKDGAQGIPGPKGEDGRTQYTHLAYANSADGKTDFSVDNSHREYIGMYVDFEQADSTDPNDYAWTLVKGANGADGTPGKPGADGKTPYFHIAYANSADGKTGFSVDNSVDKLYIGQYTDYEKADSTDPTKYSWTLIKGSDGAPGRTYEIEMSANVLKRGANGIITPATLTARAYYRDGTEATRHAYAGRWKVLVSEDGVTYTQMDVSTSDASSKSYTVRSLNAKYTYVRFELYAAGGTSAKLDMQSIPITVDVDALTQEQIVSILSDNGAWKGVYYLNGHLYISLDALLGNCAVLGGKKNGNGYLKIQDDKGTVKGLVDYSGYTAFTSYEENAEYMEYTGVQFSSEGILPVEFTKYFGDNAVDIDTSATEWGIRWNSEGLSIQATEVSAGTGEFRNLTAKNCDLEITNFSATGTVEFGDSSNVRFHNSFRVQGYPTVTSGYNAYIDINTYKLGKYSSSSERYKILGDELSDEFLEELYKITPIMARYKDGYLAEHDERVGIEFPMFRAEDVDKYFPLAVDHVDGKPENWNERIMIPAMFAMLKQQRREIEELKQKIENLIL